MSEETKNVEEYEKQKKKLIPEPLKVDISVDTTDIEKIAKQKAELEAKLNPSLESKLGSNVIRKLKEKAEALGVEYDSLETEADAVALMSAIKEEEARLGRKVPSGSIPLSPAQRGEKSEDSEGFDSYEELIDSIRNIASKRGTPEAKQAEEILDKLWLKWLEAQQNLNQNFSYERKGDEPISEELAKRFRKRKGFPEKENLNTSS